MDLSNAKCGHCQFWVTSEPGGVPDRTGHCRRYPPQLTPNIHTDTPSENQGRSYSETYSTTDSEWPETLESQWCGEFLETSN